MKTLKVIALLAVATQLSACATLFGDDSQLINVRASNEKSFDAKLSDGTSFKAPGTVTLKKDGSQPVKIITQSEGCTPVTTVDRQLQGIFWANVVSGGLLGSGTDYISGKMWDYDTNVVIGCTK